jgi:hypothetical protein
MAVAHVSLAAKPLLKRLADVMLIIKAVGVDFDERYPERVIRKYYSSSVTFDKGCQDVGYRCKNSLEKDSQ